MTLDKKFHQLIQTLSVLMNFALEYNDEILHYFDQYYDQIFNYLFRGCFYKKEDAEDLTQHTFLNLIDYMYKYPERVKKIKNMKDFIFTIATNLLKRYHKKKGKKNFQLDIEIPDDAEDPSDKRYEEKLTIVMNAMKQLEPRDQIVINLKSFQDKTFREISGYMNIKENTIKAIYYRAVDKLKIIINGEDEKR